MKDLNDKIKELVKDITENSDRYPDNVEDVRNNYLKIIVYQSPATREYRIETYWVGGKNNGI